MKNKKQICPICEKGELRKGMIQENMFGVDLGKFPAQICTKCGESFTDEKTTIAIEKKAKEKGIWGMGKMTKISKSGNSLAIRIPKQIADYLNLKKGREVFVHPENHKIIMEPN